MRTRRTVTNPIACALPDRWEHTQSLLSRAAAPGPIRGAALRAWRAVVDKPERSAFALQHHLRGAAELKSWERRLLAAGLYALVRHHRLWAAALECEVDDGLTLWRGFLADQGLEADPNGALLPRLTEQLAAEVLARHTDAQALALAGSVPDSVAHTLWDEHGRDAAAFLAATAHRAPPVARALTDRASLLTALAADGHDVGPHPASETAIRFTHATDIRSLPQARAGLVTTQDAGSQWITDQLHLEAGQTVVDLCAGRGGKTLGLAHAVGPLGHVYAVEPRKDAASAMRKRLHRAGLSDRVTIVVADGTSVDLPEADRVLVDVPCSGSGTLRRDPCRRFRLEDGLPQLLGLQRDLLTRGLHLCRPGGILVYATCSIWRRENEEQVAPLSPEWQGRLWPQHHDTDGFFAARFQR